MHRAAPHAALSLLLLLAPSAASGQTPDATAPATPEGVVPENPAPPELTIDDPMLAPVPPAPRMISSFREGLAIIDARSTNLQIAVQEVARAQGIARQTLGQALPQLYASGQVTFSLIRNEAQTVDATTGNRTTALLPRSPTALAQITLSQDVLAPRTWYAIGTAKRNTEAAELGVTEARRLVLGGVADSVVSVVTAERISEISRVSLRSSLERLRLTERMFQLGSGTKLDVVRADQDVAQARATLVQSDETLRQSREALGLALGYSEAFGVPTTISLDDFEQNAREVCEPGAPEARSDVRVAQKILEVDERAVTDSKLAYLPTAVVSTTATYSSELLGTREHYAWSIQGLITVPIWDGGSRYGVTRSAKAVVAEQRARVESTLRGANIEAEQSRRFVTVAESLSATAAQTRDLSREVARLAQVAYQAGTGTSFDLVNSAQQARQAELDLAVREFNVIKARLAALLATANCHY